MKTINKQIMLFILFCLFGSISQGQAQYAIKNSTFSNGVAISTDSTNYNSQNIAGQSFIGVSDNNVNSLFSGFYYSGWSIPTSLDDLASELPIKFELFQNYPNPFNPVTNIKYSLPKTSKVKIDVFNVLGQHVTTLVNTKKSAGYHIINFDASRFSSGLYIYTIKTEGYTNVKKMMLIK